MQPDVEKKKEAVNALLRILALEGVIIAVVVAVYLATGKLNYLIGGMIGSQIIVAPMMIGWLREKAVHLKAGKPS